MRPIITLICTVAITTACATHDPGWQASDAEPFGTADSVCQAEADATRSSERDMAYRACMARHGWTRPPQPGQR